MTALARLDSDRSAKSQGDVENIRNGCANHVVTGMGTSMMNLCREIFVTYTYDVPKGSTFFDAKAVDLASHEQFVAANPLKNNQTTEWEGDPVAAIFTCNDRPTSRPVAEIEPETSGSKIGVTIEMPKLPKYSRDGETLNKAYDDFVGRR